jgi:hypothetical protein
VPSRNRPTGAPEDIQKASKAAVEAIGKEVSQLSRRPRQDDTAFDYLAADALYTHIRDQVLQNGNMSVPDAIQKMLSSTPTWNEYELQNFRNFLQKAKESLEPTGINLNITETNANRRAGRLISISFTRIERNQ